MEIIYQLDLQNSPSIKNNITGYIDTLVPLGIDEITTLETTYNNGNQFPTSLRELLYLAGGYCYVLDYGLFDTQEQFQEGARFFMTQFGRNLSITRPFYIIDAYNIVDQFIFVYLDEGVADPYVYQAYLSSTIDGLPWLRSLNYKLSDYIHNLTNTLKSGFNPF